MHDSRWRFVLRRRQWCAVSCAALVLTGPAAAHASGDRCGWLDLSSSGARENEVVFRDGEQNWRIDRNAGRWPVIRQSDMYPNTTRSEVYSGVHNEDYLTCACMVFESVEYSHVSKISHARLIPIARCLNDKKLWQPTD